MTNFCTLFDHNYLSRGLVMYESLKTNCSDKFKLYILATNDIAYKWLNENPQKNVQACSLEEIKAAYPVLERLQKERSATEFNWTLSSFSIQFFLKKFKLPSVTYLDADLRFYADTKVLFEGLKKESVIITPHNYTPRYDQSATSGRYCVQFTKGRKIRRPKVFGRLAFALSGKNSRRRQDRMRRGAVERPKV